VFVWLLSDCGLLDIAIGYFFILFYFFGVFVSYVDGICLFFYVVGFIFGFDGILLAKLLLFVPVTKFVLVN
jgi:hypothetical protein